MAAVKSDNQDRAFINLNFIIKIYYDDPNAETKLIGAGQLAKHIGEHYALKVLEKAFNTSKQMEEIRVRNLKATVKLISR